MMRTLRIVAVVMVVGLGLAVMACRQETTPQNGTPTTGIAALRRDAESGNADAQRSLGVLYAYGQGVQQDYTQAVAWYRKAAEQGHPFAQSDLGYMYKNGVGVPQDFTQAAAWYRKAAEQGHANAQVRLGLSYFNGEGVPQDFVSAHLYYNLAASRATVFAQKTFAGYRDEVAKKMPPQQIAEAQKLAREWQAAFDKRQAQQK